MFDSAISNLINLYSLQFDEGKAVFDGELTTTDVQNFISVYSLPLVVEFNQDTAQKIFSGDIKSHLLVFLSKEAGHFEKYVEGIHEPAKKYRGEVRKFRCHLSCVSFQKGN